ncbi:hypothetical protein KK092_14960 [Curtobacterium flaccumfaciens pv. flaccumfaciens]|uniref:hypothetical protein n=1 Tax=Curtobacterium flaccumfaciens TaxID=2035 RepID=UPI001BDF511F|nr:hypothetical protein [Curtobacterium flaccumfaciens]MBT1670681.1 hypothetical protein [Curtobacterium flaccumfaciens pv. flaccumfaciens]
MLPREVRAKSLPGVLRRAWVAGFSTRVLPVRPVGCDDPEWTPVEFLLDVESTDTGWAEAFEIEFTSAMTPRCRRAIRGQGCQLVPISRSHR